MINNKKRELVQWFMLIGVIGMIHIIANCSVNYLYRKDFVPNGEDFAYSQGIPLHEMEKADFKKYDKYLRRSIVVSSGTQMLELPCDVEYYERKEDAKPAYVLRKGSIVSLNDVFNELGYGYGLECWPDYDDEWRYGRPFATEELLENDYEQYYKVYNDMYYVKEEQLRKVAEHIYDEYIIGVPWYLQSFYLERVKKMPIRGWYVDQAIYEIDCFLYEGGVFCAPYFSLQRVRNEYLYPQFGRYIYN